MVTAGMKWKGKRGHAPLAVYRKPMLSPTSRQWSNFAGVTYSFTWGGIKECIVRHEGADTHEQNVQGAAQARRRTQPRHNPASPSDDAWSAACTGQTSRSQPQSRAALFSTSMGVAVRRAHFNLAISPRSIPLPCPTFHCLHNLLVRLAQAQHKGRLGDERRLRLFGRLEHAQRLPVRGAPVTDVAGGVVRCGSSKGVRRGGG